MRKLKSQKHSWREMEKQIPPYDLPCELIVMLEMKREGFEVLKVEKARAKA